MVRKTGPNPTDKGKPGMKRHVVVDRRGIPLSVMTSAANVNDSMLFEELLDSIEPRQTPEGQTEKASRPSGNLVPAAENPPSSRF